MKLLGKTVLLAVLLASPLAGAQTLRNRSVPVCTDTSNIQRANEEGFIDCDWLKAGTALGSPFYVQVKSWNSNLQLEVETWATIYGTGIGATDRLVLTASTIMGMDTATGNTAEVATVSVPAVSMTAPQWLLNTNSFMRFYDGTNYHMQYGGQLNSDAVATTQWAADSRAFGFFYDETNGNWSRDTGDAMDSDSIATTSEAPRRAAFGHLYDSTGGVWERAITNGSGVQITIPGDGTDVVDVLGDLNASQATTTDALAVASFLYGFDGTDFERVSTDTSGNLEIVGTVAHDGIDSGSPVKVGARARTSQITAVAEDDRTDLVANAYGEQVIAGHTWATDSNRAEEIDPISQHYAAETVVNVTDYAESAPPHTEYYYVDMAGYSKSAWQLSLDSDAGTVTVTIECSVEDDGTAPASCAYEDVTSDMFGVASLISSAAPATDLWIDDTGALGLCKYVRIKAVYNTGAGSDSGDVTVYHKRMY